MGLNVACILRESAKRDPDRAALLFDGGELTYGELDALSDRLAAGLLAKGFQPGDRVGLQLPNVPQFVVSYFGILKAGCVVLPLNVLLGAADLASQLRDAEPRALVTWSGAAAEAAEATERSGVARSYVVSTPGAPLPEGATPWEELLAAADPPASGVLEQRDPGDTAVVVYTSGTTGRPKGAELTHFQLLMNADTPGRIFGIREDDVILLVMPLFHIFGLSSQLDVCVRFGATMSLVPQFDARRVLEVVARDRVTVMAGVPSMYQALLAAADEAVPDGESILRVVVSGGASMPAAVVAAFEERFGAVVLEGYGLTETASTTTFSTSATERRAGSVGRAVWGVDVEVWGDDDFPLPPGRVGEVVVRGVNVMKGYWRDTEATAAAFTRGWLRTGDLGHVDDEGYLFIKDRKADLVVQDGRRLYPREVEEILYQHPGIAEAAVVGVPDARLGELMTAFVVPRPGAGLSAEDVLGFVRERLPAEACPGAAVLRDALPHGSTGKVLKSQLR
jgi:long-chain acyl-CoA synthetase